MTIDLTGIAVSLIAGVFSVLAIVLPLVINARIKDAQAAAVLGNAVKNSLGAIEQAATLSVNTLQPSVTIPGVPASLAPGVQYVLNHAGPEAARFGITAEAIADKVNVQIGLSKIAAIQANAPVAPALAAVVPPVAPDLTLPPPPKPMG